MDRKYTIRLKQITYGGTNIGNDWHFKIYTDRPLHPEPKDFGIVLNHGDQRQFDKLLHSATVPANGPHSLPIEINAVERDPSTDDSNTVLQTFSYDPNKLGQPQAQVISLTIAERRKEKESPTQQAVLQFTLELTVEPIQQPAPEITTIDPRQGPLTSPMDDPYYVYMEGKNFREGVKAFIGGKEAAINERSTDGTKLKLILPDGDEAGTVPVKIQNLDGTEAEKKKGFQYLAEGDLPRPTIRKIVPLQVIEGATTPVRVTGRHLIEANLDKLFAIKGPDNVTLKMGEVKPSMDPQTGEETLEFDLTATSSSILLFTERTILQVMVSLRENAVNDLVAEESSHFITLLPSRDPVALAYTIGLGVGDSQMLMVAGRNLQNAQLRLKNPKGVEVVGQYSEDRLAVLLVNVRDDQGKVDVDGLELLGPTNRILTTLPLEMNTDLRVAEATPGQPIVPQLVEVPGQKVKAPKKGSGKVYLVRTGEVLERNMPYLQGNENLRDDLTFPIESFEIPIPVLDDVLIFNLTDRGGDLLQGGNDARVGKIFRLRNLDFIIVLQVQLVIRVDVLLFVGFNPFLDYPSALGFDAYSPETPSDTFGTITLEIRVELSFSFRILFLAALILPPIFDPDLYKVDLPGTYPDLNPGRPLGLELMVLAVFLLDLQVDFNDSLGGHIMLDLDTYVRVTLKPKTFPVRFKYEGSDGIQLLLPDGVKEPTAFPDHLKARDRRGLVTYFFARAAGKYCIDLQRSEMELQLGFLSSREERPLQIATTTTICLDVKDGNKFVFNPVPKKPEVEEGASTLLWIYRAQEEDDGMGGKKMTPDNDKFIDPASYQILSDMEGNILPQRSDAKDPDAGTVRDWYLKGIQKGLAKITLKIDPNKQSTPVPGTISAAATALLPSQDIHFGTLPNVLIGLIPTIELQLLDEVKMPLTEAKCISAKAETKKLNAERSRLWRNYVNDTAPGMDPMTAWQALSSSKRGIFLTLTHKLHFAKDPSLGANVSGLAQVVEILTLRGNVEGNCTGANANRMFVKLGLKSSAPLRTLAASDVVSNRFFDCTTGTYPGDAVIRGLRGEKGKSSPFTRCIATDPAQPPRTFFYLLVPKDFTTPSTQEVSLAKLRNRLKLLTQRTAPASKADAMMDQIVELDPANPQRGGSKICLNQVPQVMEIQTVYGKQEQCTDRPGVKLLMDSLEFKSTGRRAYQYFFGNFYTIDFAWSPSGCSPKMYSRNDEEQLGERTLKGTTRPVEDAMIDRDPYGPLPNHPDKMRVLVDRFKTMLKGISATDPDARQKFLSVVTTVGRQLLGRGRAIAREQDSAKADDRVLYWARLQAGVELKSHDWYVCALAADRIAILRAFEAATRGYDQIDFNPQQQTKRVVLSGFDPFSLGANQWQSNPSGAAALALHGQTLTVQGVDILIQTVIFPVRYRDFQQDCGLGVVEAVATPFFDQAHPGHRKIDLFMSMSLTDLRRFDVDRFAARNRGMLPDNENEPQGITLPFPFAVPGKEYYETKLPFLRIVPPSNQGRKYPIYYNNTFSYRKGSATVEFMTRYDGTLGVEKIYPSLVLPTKATGSDFKSIMGSGGHYLSNEIFYRLTRLRTQLKSQLPTGHLHVPFIQDELDDFPPLETQEVINEIKMIIQNAFDERRGK